MTVVPCAVVPGVTTGPGAMALTLTPLAANSAAQDFVSSVKAAFDAP